jgi:hypothetical protein
MDFNRLKPFLAKFIKQETGRELEIRGAVDFKIGLRPSLVMEDLLFQNAPWASRAEMVRIQRLEVKIKLLPLLNKDIRMTRLVLTEPELFLETDKTGKWNFEFERAEAPSLKSPTSQDIPFPRMAFDQVQIEKGRVSYRDGRRGTLHDLSIDRFTARSEGVESPVVLDFAGAYRGKPLELKGTVGSLLRLKEPGKEGYPVDLVAKAAGAQLSVEGTVRDILRLKGLALKTVAEVQSTSQVAAFLGEIFPLELGPLRVSATLSDGEEHRYSLSGLTVTSQAGDLGGALTVNLGESRPRLSGSVTCRTLNVSSFFNGGKTKAPKADAGARSGKVFPNDPLPLDLLKAMDVSLQFRADQMHLPHLPLANLSLEASLNDGRLDLRPIKAKAAGGEAEGVLEVLPQGRVAVVKAVIKITQMDLQTLLPEWKAEGKVDADLDLLGRGTSIAGLMAGLSGRTVAVMGRGRVDNKAIQILGGDLARGMFQLLSPSSRAVNRVEINCAVSGFDVKEGTAKVTALVVDTPDMSVIGEGQVNLGDETLDLALRPYPKGNAAGLNMSLAELAKTFKLGGTLASPSLEMDAEQTIFTALKAAGGVVLFGPAGLLAALAGQSSGEENPCLSALESARKGTGPSESGKGVEQKKPEDKSVTGTLKGVGESVKKLFTGQETGTPPRSEPRTDPYRGGGP